MAHTERRPERFADPDMFDLLLQGLSALSSVASLGVTWLQIRSIRNARRTADNQDQVRQHLRKVERELGDLFDEIRTAIRIMEPAFKRQHGRELLKEPNRFGAQVQLTQAELQTLAPILAQMSGNFVKLKAEAIGAILLLQHTSYPGEQSISDNLDDLNAELNKILFESADLEDALEALQRAKLRAEQFLRQLQRFSN